MIELATRAGPGRRNRGYPLAAGHQGFRRDIQGLRALAVILVIGNHAGIPGFAGGYVGVDLFFVVSGYVITQLLLREAAKGPQLGLTEFYSRRVRRIVPAATATLIGALVASTVVLGARTNPNLAGDVRWASVFAANFRLIATGSNYFVPGAQPSLVTQFWSLAVEEQFYLAFPLIVFLVARFVRYRHRTGALSLTLGALVAASAWWCVQISPSEPSTAYYSAFTRFWELGLGCLVACLTSREPARARAAEGLAVALGSALLVLALVKLNSASIYPGWLAWLPCAAAALLLWAGHGGARTPVAALLSTRPLRYIGDISYSLYLWHYLWLELPKQLPSPPTGPGWLLAEVAGTVVTAVVSYHLLEVPVRRSPRLAGDRAAVFLVLCACVIASWTAASIAAHLGRLG